MSGECEICSEHTLDCLCEARLKIAMESLNIALQELSYLGYELTSKIEFKKI